MMEYASRMRDRSPDESKFNVFKTDFKDEGNDQRKFRRQPKPDENAPERPPSAYVLFSNEMRLRLYCEGLSSTAVAQIVGKAWNNLSPKERESYEAQSFRAKQEYNTQLNEYKRTNNYRKYSEYLAEFKTRYKRLENGTPSSAPPLLHPYWRERQDSAIAVSEDRFESSCHIEETPFVSRNFNNFHNLSPLKIEALDDLDVDMTGCSPSIPPSNSSSHPPNRLYSRPPMIRSYGSSSGSSASALMTPRDTHSWVGSTYSPSLFETNDSVSSPSPYQANHFITQLAKDMIFDDFPTNPEFRFSSFPISDSPERADQEWLLEDDVTQGQIPIFSFYNDSDFRQPKSNDDNLNYCSSNAVITSAKTSEIPGLGIITKNGTYREGSRIPSKTRVRHGPLSAEQAKHAAKMRRIGACKQCRKKKVRCNILHYTSPSGTSSPMTIQDKTLSFSSVALALIIIRRSMECRYQKQIILPDISDTPISERINQQASCFENMTLHGFDLQSLLLRSQGTTEGSESNSINSFEDDFTEYSRDDSAIYIQDHVPNAGSEEFLSAIQPYLDQLPPELASSLGNELLSLFGIWLGNRASYQQAICEGNSSPPNSQNPHGSTLTPTNSTSSVPKRLSDDGSGDSSPSGNRGDGQRKRPRNISQTPSGSARKWACPYYQRDPHTYCVVGDFGDYRKCSKSPGFSEVHRVKQHLYDCHAAIYCTRCYSQFKKKEELVEHRRSRVPCGLRDPKPLEGLNEDQRELLKPRDRNKSEEERWKNVYKICFPTDQIIPSPYYVHYTRETALLRRQVLQIVEEETLFVDNIIRERLLQRLQNAFDSNAQTSGPSHSPLWPSGVLDLSGNDGNFMPMHNLPASLAPPWSEWDIRHSNPENVGHNNDAAASLLQNHSLPNTSNDDEARFSGPGLDESTFFIPEIGGFDYRFDDGHESPGNRNETDITGS